MDQHSIPFKRMVVLTIASVLILTVYLMQHIHVMNINFEISKLETQVKKLRHENEKMEIQLAKNLSLEAMDEVAVKKLSMQRPVHVEYVLISTLNAQEAKK